MYRGKLVEMGTAADVFDRPSHGYTKALISAIPQMTPGERIPRVIYNPAS
jgi:oligopeptide/dipeptide ABC transporter ATP-binding protein